MSSIYDGIKTPKELLQEVRINGLSTKQEDIYRAQDIFGHAPIADLVELANDNGKLKDFNGTPDPRGTIVSGREGFSKCFYQVLFHIWNWEDATRFYNQHSNFLVIDAMEERKTLHQKVDQLGKELEHVKSDLIQEHNERLNATTAELGARKKIDLLEAEVHDRDMTIMELKAKLYDLMTKTEL